MVINFYKHHAVIKSKSSNMSLFGELNAAVTITDDNVW